MPVNRILNMAEKRDYYEVLGVEKNASTADISSAYRKLAVKYHPDSNPDDEEAMERFKEAAEAYEMLSDDEKRAQYDRFGHSVGGGGRQFHDVEDIFDAFGDLFGGGVFGDLFGGRSRRRTRQRRGADVRCEVVLDLEEAAFGVTKTVSVARREACDTCSGSGSKPGSERETCRRCAGHGQVVQSAGILRVQTTCPICQGSGQMIQDACEDCSGEGAVPRSTDLEVKIPAGVDDGIRIRISGQGESGPDNGPAGDAYCFVSVREHSLFQRHGDDLVLRVPITYSQAVLGTTIQVSTLDGPEDLKIPAGTQSGDQFRVRKKGVPNVHDGHRGDLVALAFIEVPENVSSEQAELLRQLAELEDVQLTPERKSFFEKIKDYFSSKEVNTD